MDARQNQLGEGVDELFRKRRIADVITSKCLKPSHISHSAAEIISVEDGSRDNYAFFVSTFPTLFDHLLRPGLLQIEISFFFLNCQKVHQLIFSRSVPCAVDCYVVRNDTVFWT